MKKKITSSNNNVFLLIVGLFVSYAFFGITIPFFISIIFTTFLGIKTLQNLDDRNLLSAVNILGPILIKFEKQIPYLKIDYSTISNAISSILSKNGINYTLTNEDVVTAIVYFILLLFVLLIGIFDNTTIGKHLPSEDSEFKKRSFKEDNANFCEFLSRKLDRVNESLQWHEGLYVPIAAEVEMARGKKLKKYDDILKCLKDSRQQHTTVMSLIKHVKYSFLGKQRLINYLLNWLEKKFDKKNVYLLLGDPGSGKSVSLRKLCHDLLSEAHITGKTPVYISLKTWGSKNCEWNDTNLPSIKDLTEYVKEELYIEGNYLSDQFLDNYFEKMLNDGRWYFIFDSFDEMPCLMGNNKNDELIKHISRLLYDFLTGPNQSGGIIASRLYNRPSESLNQTCTLRLKSFNDSRIRSMIKNYISYDSNVTIKTLFRDRRDLVELCRNPFHLALLINYINKQHMVFPSNQFDLFKDFIDECLERSKKKIANSGLSLNDIYLSAIELSLIMQENAAYGLEFPVGEIYKYVGEPEKVEIWKKYLSILVYIKLCRFGGNHQTISFVHRRFQEFFFVEGIIQGRVSISPSDYKGILNNTGIRDSLVLYCQIGEEEKIKDIVNYCCNAIERNLNKISNILNDGCVELVNSLYFLTEAFNNRKNVLKDNIVLISNLRDYLKNDTDYIILLAIVNSISLLDKDDIESTMLDTFKLRNRWLSSSIVSNCQIVKKLNLKTEIGFCHYFDTLANELIDQFFNIDFSLSLSSGFTYVRIVHIFSLLEWIISLYIFIQGLFYFLAPFVPMIIKDIVFFLKSFNKLGFTTAVNLIVIRMAEYRNSSISSKMILSFYNHHFLCVELFLCSFVIILKSIWRTILMYINNNSFNEKIKIEKFKKPTNILKTYFQILETPFVRQHTYVDTEFSSIIIKMLIPICGFLLIANVSTSFEPILLLFLFTFLFSINIFQIMHEFILPVIKFIKSADLYNNFKVMRETVLKIHIVSNISIKMYNSLVLSFVPLITFLIPIGLVFVIVFGITFFVFIYTGIEASTVNIDIIASLVLIFVFFFGLFLFFIGYLIIYAVDCSWLRKQHYKEIDRELFTNNIKKLRTRSIRRAYLQEMVKNDVKLTGNWPNGRRILLSDDVFNRDLAIWDCKEHSIDNYFTKGM